MMLPLSFARPPARRDYAARTALPGSIVPLTVAFAEAAVSGCVATGPRIPGGHAEEVTMRVFIACLGTETNTFSSLPTGELTYLDTALFDGDATPPRAHALQPAAAHLARACRGTEGTRSSEGLCAFAQPAGRTIRRVYEDYRDRILAQATAALPLDLVLVNMHGAMVAEGYDDCEGDLLARLREVIGPDTVLGGELDLHCHITPLMLEAATALITYKEYPHIDIGERAEDLFRLCHDAALGRTRPVMAAHDCRMISMWRTTGERDAGLRRRHEGARRAGRGPRGFLRSRLPVGRRGRGGRQDACGGRRRCGQGGRARRRSRRPALGDSGGDPGPPPWASTRPLTGRLAVDRRAGRAGGRFGQCRRRRTERFHLHPGAPDRARRSRDVASGLYWDPVAVRFCMEAGEGARLNLRIGGKCGPDSGDPVDLTVNVKRIATGADQTFGSARNRIGDAAWVRADGGLDLVLNTIRTQVFHPDAFTAVGLDPADKKIVVVKSTQHFHAGFAPIAAEILYVAAPGAIPPDFAAIPYTKLARSPTGPGWKTPGRHRRHSREAWHRAPVLLSVPRSGWLPVTTHCVALRRALGIGIGCPRWVGTRAPLPHPGPLDSRIRGSSTMASFWHWIY